MDAHELDRKLRGRAKQIPWLYVAVSLAQQILLIAVIESIYAGYWLTMACMPHFMP